LSYGDLDGKNHILCTDNWYTSLEVADICLSHEVNFIGTVKSNRKGTPKSHIFPYKGKFKRERGEMLGMEMVYNENNLFFTAWQDVKPVHMISTYQSEKHFCQRNSKDQKGDFVKVLIERPTVIGHYNKAMGGTDLCDQKVSYYSFEHQSIKWTHRIFTHFIMVAASNAHILFNCNKAKENKSSFLDFLLILIDDLVGEYKSSVYFLSENESEYEEHSQTSSVASKRRKFETLQKSDSGRLTGKHTPYLVRTKEPDERGRCVLCDKKSNVKCFECNVSLHLGSDPLDNCWFAFHSDEEIHKHNQR